MSERIERTIDNYIGDTHVPIEEVAAELQSIGAWLAATFGADELRDDDDDDDSPGYTEVRLQVHRGWAIHSGDPSYDTDHRGYWGSGCISRGASPAECDTVARDLLAQADEQWGAKRRSGSMMSNTPGEHRSEPIAGR